MTGTRAKQWLLLGASSDYEKDYCIVTNADDEGYDFYIAYELDAWTREALYDKILAVAKAVSIVRVEPEEIDEINILNATKKAMRQAVEEIKDKADLAFVDAVKLDLPIPEVAIIKGDAKSYNIAAASIVAKVYRDRLMYGYAEKYPEYDFASNKGYGTAKHIAALKEYGATPIHRRSFIKNFVNE